MATNRRIWGTSPGRARLSERAGRHRSAKTVQFALLLPLAGLYFSCWTPQSAGADSFPALHGDLQRTGFYPAFPQGELEMVWRKEFLPNQTGPRAEAIVGEGLVFYGDYSGRLCAFDLETGAEQWRHQTGGPIGHSPAYSDGRVFAGSMDGTMYCFNAGTGNVIWRRSLSSGIWVSPAVSRCAVYFGARDGVFYALSTEDGRELWRFGTGAMILNSAAFSEDESAVLFASEDMRLYCLDAGTGALRWKSRKLHGLTFRDYFPVVSGGLVMVTTTPVKDFHTALGEHEKMFLSWGEFEGEDDRYIPVSEAAVKEEQRRIVEFLKRNPAEQTFYAFRIEDGEEPWVAPLLYTGGLHNPMTPPCVNKTTGGVFVFVRSAYGVWDGGGEVRSYTGIGRLNLEDGTVDLIQHGYPSRDANRPPGRKDMPWMTFNTIGDETQILTCSPDLLINTHQGYIGAYDFESGLTRRLYGKRDTYGGFYGPGTFGWESDGGKERARDAGEPFGILNEWHGPSRAAVSVAGDYVLFPVGSQLICLKAKE